MTFSAFFLIARKDDGGIYITFKILVYSPIYRCIYLWKLLYIKLFNLKVDTSEVENNRNEKEE
jgi:hypothetical protein